MLSIIVEYYFCEESSHFPSFKLFHQPLIKNMKKEISRWTPIIKYQSETYENLRKCRLLLNLRQGVIEYQYNKNDGCLIGCEYGDKMDRCSKRDCNNPRFKHKCCYTCRT